MHGGLPCVFNLGVPTKEAMGTRNKQCKQSALSRVGLLTDSAEKLNYRLIHCAGECQKSSVAQFPSETRFQAQKP